MLEGARSGSTWKDEFSRKVRRDEKGDAHEEVRMCFLTKREVGVHEKRRKENQVLLPAESSHALLTVTSCAWMRAATSSVSLRVAIFQPLGPALVEIYRNQRHVTAPFPLAKRSIRSIEIANR